MNRPRSHFSNVLSLMVLGLTGLLPIASSTAQADTPSLAPYGFQLPSSLDRLTYSMRLDGLDAGGIVRGTWIAVNVGDGEYENFTIASSDLELTREAGDEVLEGFSESSWPATFSLTRPTKGWPPGRYRLDVFVGRPADEASAAGPVEITARIPDPNGTVTDPEQPGMNFREVTCKGQILHSAYFEIFPDGSDAAAPATDE